MKLPRGVCLSITHPHREGSGCGASTAQPRQNRATCHQTRRYRSQAHDLSKIRAASNSEALQTSPFREAPQARKQDAHPHQDQQTANQRSSQTSEPPFCPSGKSHPLNPPRMHPKPPQNYENPYPQCKKCAGNRQISPFRRLSPAFHLTKPCKIFNSKTAICAKNEKIKSEGGGGGPTDARAILPPHPHPGHPLPGGPSGQGAGGRSRARLGVSTGLHRANVATITLSA